MCRLSSVMIVPGAPRGPHAAIAQAAVELHREQHVRRLGPAVRRPRVVRRMLEVRVVEVDADRRVTGRARLRCATAFPASSSGTSGSRGRSAEVVRAELRLEAVRPSCPRARHHAGVAMSTSSGRVGEDSVAERPHRGEVGEVERAQLVAGRFDAAASEPLAPCRGRERRGSTRPPASEGRRSSTPEAGRGAVTRAVVRGEVEAGEHLVVVVRGPLPVPYGPHVDRA